MNKKLKVLFGTSLIIVAGTVAINSCVHEPYVLPASLRTNDPNICFERDILPVFVSNCAMSGCHNAQSHKGGYTLDNYQDIVSKGIVPGNYAASSVYESMVSGNSGEDGGLMPRNAPALSGTQLDLIKRWIVAGAVDAGACASACDSNNFTYSGAIAPMMRTYCVGCHSSPTSTGGSLADYNSVMNAAVNGKLIGNISHQPGYNAMPIGMQLSDCEIAQVKKWVAAGALNN